MYERGEYYRFNKGLMFELTLQLEQAKQLKADYELVEASLNAFQVIQELEEAVAERNKTEKQKAKEAIVSIMEEIETLEDTEIEPSLSQTLTTQLSDLRKQFMAEKYLEVQTVSQALKQTMVQLKQTQEQLVLMKGEAASLTDAGLSEQALQEPRERLIKAETAIREARYEKAIKELNETAELLRDIKSLQSSLVSAKRHIQLLRQKAVAESDVAITMSSLELAQDELQQGHYSKARLKWKELQDSLNEHGLLLVGIGVSILATKHVDYDPADAWSEASNIEAFLKSIKNLKVSLLKDFTVSALHSALSEHRVLVVPTLDNGDIAKEAAQGILPQIKEFVQYGGTLITFYPQDELQNFLNTAFHFNIKTTSTSTNGKYKFHSSEAQGTPFSAALDNLDHNQYMRSLVHTSLPPEAKVIYSDSNDNSVVSLIPVGQGNVIVLGWDWSQAAPVGKADGGWLKILELAIGQPG